MAKKMTPAMRLWRDENMEAIREGVKAVKEGRTTPADTFFEWMQAKYVRGIWEERIARLQERVEEAEQERDRALHELATSTSEGHLWDERYDKVEALAERRKEALALFPKIAGCHRKRLLLADAEVECDHCDKLMAEIRELCDARAAIEKGGNESCTCYDLHGFSPDPTCPAHQGTE